MASLETLQQMFEEYDRKAQKVRSKASRFAGAFNLGDDPRRHECHEDFFEDVGRWAGEFLEGSPSEQEVTEAVCWLLKAADANREKDCYWFLYAAQIHAKDLIPRMDREVCGQLLEWYDEAYPALDRLPAQQEVAKKLRQHCGKASGRSGGLFAFLRKK